MKKQDSIFKTLNFDIIPLIEDYKPIRRYYNHTEKRFMVGIIHKKNNKKNKYMSYARFYMSYILRRWLNDNEEAHHINSDKGDDRPSNIKYLTKEEHEKISNNDKTSYKPLISIGCSYCLSNEIVDRLSNIKAKNKNWSKMFLLF